MTSAFHVTKISKQTNINDFHPIFLFNFLQFFFVANVYEKIHPPFSIHISIHKYRSSLNTWKKFFHVTNFFVPCVKWVQVHRKQPMGLLYKRIVNPFQFFFIFSYERFFNEIFCNFLFKIHIVAPLNHMFCGNHCRINMFFSKCVNFAKFCTSS